ncbi:ferredoxin Fer [Halobaculum sp. D14]|uniref:ferredoxin Fer n=1 Tax=Halobaculum sp. D14 TaxID=3421642 RepID=UPI003EBB006A
MDSPFEVLGLDADADDEEIERAYRRRVLETHPDHGGSAEEFQAVRAAYEELQSGDWADVDVRPSSRGADGDADGDEASGGENGRSPGAARQQSGSGSGSGSGDEGAPSRQTTARVEYLNYDVVADRGWSLDDDDLFDAAADADLDPDDYGQFLVEPHESLLEAAENRGFAWPYACRGGACANCAVAVVEGELDMPANHVLSEEMLDRGFRLSCIGAPLTDELKVVYNVKHLPGLDDLRLPADRFERTLLND